MSKLAAVHPSELRLGRFRHFKYGCQSSLAQSDPQESSNLQAIKNRIHNIIFSLCVQDSGNLTSWCLEDMNFRFFAKPRPHVPHWEVYSALPSIRL